MDDHDCATFPFCPLSVPYSPFIYREYQLNPCLLQESAMELLRSRCKELEGEKLALAIQVQSQAGTIEILNQRLIEFTTEKNRLLE